MAERVAVIEGRCYRGSVLNRVAVIEELVPFERRTPNAEKRVGEGLVGFNRP